MIGQTTHRIEVFDQLAPLEDEWSDLAEASGNIFNTWEWISLWWDHFGHDRELAVAAAFDEDDRIATILPLYFWRRRPGRVLRFLGHGASDELGPICGKDTRVTGADALLRYLEKTQRRWDVFLGENLPITDDWHDVLGATVLRTESNPVLASNGAGWEEFLASRSSHFRKQVAKRERVLNTRHDVRFRVAEDPARLENDLDVLFALHAARWSNGKSSFVGPREAFYRDFAASALERGWLRLSFLEVDGQPVASLYSFRFGGVESTYQVGRDPTWDHASVGYILFVNSIRAALTDGIAEFRFLRGDDPWKARFATHDRPLETVAVASDARGRALVTAAGVLRSSSRVRKALRAPLEA